MITETNTQLLRGVKTGDILTVRRLIASGADINCEDLQGWTPLFTAAHSGHVEMIRLLIDAGAAVNSHQDTGFTPLFSAVLGRHIDAIRVLLEAGAAPDITPSGNPLVERRVGPRGSA